MTTDEIFTDMEMQCTGIKQRVYALRESVQKLKFDPQVEISLIEHLNKIFSEFDSFQTFCKSRMNHPPK